MSREALHADDWFSRVPKVELHLHLEGAIPLPFLWQLIQHHGGDAEVCDFAALEQRFIYRDFHHFLRTWVWKNKFLTTRDDLSDMAESVARWLQAQRIIYVEAHCSPIDFRHSGLSISDTIIALRAGLQRVPGITVNLIVDLVRNYGPDEAEKTLHEIERVRDYGVIGIGLGGDELHFPPQLFTNAFARARAMGLHVTAHAGEGAGPPSIRHALDDLHITRIGHGIRCVEDESLVADIIARQIPLEICPTSNVCTGIVRTFAEHPIRTLKQRGALITVNTDDPAMFHCDLAHEFRRLAQEHQWTHDDVRGCLLNALQASWLSEREKNNLREKMITDPEWQQ
jgi:adenosine deaminase